MTHKIHTLALCLSLSLFSSGQEATQMGPSPFYTSLSGELYVKPHQPIHFFIKTTQNGDQMVPIPSDVGNDNPLTLEREGVHYIVHKSDATGKNVRFRIVADGTAPLSKLSFTSGLLFVYNNTYFVEIDATATIEATDKLSGIYQTLVAVGPSPFEQLPSTPIPFGNPGKAELNFYSTDQVGNIETTQTAKIFVAQDASVDLENIYFNLNSAKLLNESFAELNQLAQLLTTYPKVSIELRAHTDSRGESAYNLTLSEQRAQSALEYLVSKGVARSRIKAKGYGDTRLVNHCTKGQECSDELHRQNRRVEIIISKTVEGGDK